MSRFPQRKEKDCLNCGIQLIGPFCHNCGQENIHPKQSVWHLISHFFKDITHFDGKFFTTMRYLVRKPGFLSREYIIGRRAGYVNPIRMYLFTSAVFFLVFFSLYKVDEKDFKVTSKVWDKSTVEIRNMDSAQLDKYTRKVNKGKPLTRAELLVIVDSASSFRLTPDNFKSRREYDSLVKAGVKKHSWFERQLVYKDIQLKEKYNSNSAMIVAALVNSFMHLLPQMLFVLLPLFALILKLVYVRRKEFYYVDHVIFTLHLYIFIFLVMLITFGIGKIRGWLDWEWLKFIVFLFVLGIFFYFYKALRNFYKQRRAKTILKYFILLILFFIVTLLMFVLFVFLTMFGL